VLVAVGEVLEDQSKLYSHPRKKEGKNPHLEEEDIGVIPDIAAATLNKPAALSCPRVDDAVGAGPAQSGE
jgi:hypothetical protein